jgi:hypothetical protein
MVILEPAKGATSTFILSRCSGLICRLGDVLFKAGTVNTVWDGDVLGAEHLLRLKRKAITATTITAHWIFVRGR